MQHGYIFLMNNYRSVVLIPSWHRCSGSHFTSTARETASFSLGSLEEHIRLDALPACSTKWGSFPRTIMSRRVGVVRIQVFLLIFQQVTFAFEMYKRMGKAFSWLPVVIVLTEYQMKRESCSLKVSSEPSPAQWI